MEEEGGEEGGEEGKEREGEWEEEEEEVEGVEGVDLGSSVDTIPTACGDAAASTWS